MTNKTMISLGLNCYTGAVLDRLELKRPPCPFDWMSTTIPMIQGCIESDFEQLLDRQYYKPVVQNDGQVHFKHTFYETHWPTNFTHINPGEGMGRVYLERCVDRFRDIMASSDPKTFVFTASIFPHERARYVSEFTSLYEAITARTLNATIVGVTYSITGEDPGFAEAMRIGDSRLVHYTAAGPLRGIVTQNPEDDAQIDRFISELAGVGGNNKVKMKDVSSIDHEITNIGTSPQISEGKRSMMNWRTLPNLSETHKLFSDIAKKIANRSLDIGRQHYAQSVTVAVMEAIICGHDAITIAEFGVCKGAGLLDLCKAASFFRDELQYDIRVLGFDNGVGLPSLVDYRDHPEMWVKGEFGLNNDIEPLKKSLPDFANLVIGDVGDTIVDMRPGLIEAPLAFAAIDVDLYSSTKRLMPFFTYEPQCYLPATPLYFDDVDHVLTWNSYCGEKLAIKEFNEEHEHRKIEPKESFKIPRFHVLHVLDHPVRTGAEKPRQHFTFTMVPLF